MAKLGDVFNLQMGKTPARANSAYWTDGTNDWVSIADLSSYEKYVDGTKEKITDLAVQESGIKKVPANTVIMSFKLSLGKTAITKTPVYTNEAIMAFLPSGKYDVYPDYFFHLFSGKDWSDGTNRAVMGATLNKATLSNIEIDIPPLDEQRRIAAVLDKVTDLIAQRRAQLDKLDLLVKSRFVEMFGDPATNPMGWKRTTIGQECYYIKDGPHKSLADVGTKTGYPFISVRNIVNGTIDFSTAKYISKEDYNEAIKKCNPQKGDMLYTKGGTTGIAKLVDVDIKFANWVHVAVLKFDSSLDGVFFENMLNSDYCYKQSQELTKGIANKDLVLGSMARIKMYKPPLSLQKQFAKFVKQIGKEKNFISHSLDQLQTLKKSLMQQYFGSR